MAIGDPYASLEELKDYLGVSDSSEDDKMMDALLAASREIEKICERQFNKESTPTARVYRPGAPHLVLVDDFYTTEDLVIKTDPNADGDFSVTWDSSDYELEPLNGIVDSEPGWPYFRIRAVGNRIFPYRNRRASLQVTARWGWPDVPPLVKQACLIIASETFKLKDAPFGVAGYDAYGPIRVKISPIAMGMLSPYKLHKYKVG